MLKIGDRVRDKAFPNLEGTIDEIDRNYEKKLSRIYYSVTLDDPELSYLWYQEKDLEVIDDQP